MQAQSTKLCSVPDCSRSAHARDLCPAHYYHWRINGDPLYKKPKEPLVLCSIPDCTRHAYARGWCANHYSRWLRHGTTDDIRTRPLAVRFWEKVGKTDTCWVWMGAKTNAGYGKISRFSVHRHNTFVLVHRLSYEMHKGVIPDGLVLDHLCRNHACVNPNHLEAVTIIENVHRSKALG